MDTYNLDWNKIHYLPRPVIDSVARGGDLSAGPMGVTRSVMPDVRGETVSAAFASITAAGFARGTVRYYDDPTCNNIGVVTSQTPVAGSVVAAGTPVNLSAGRRPQTPCF